MQNLNSLRDILLPVLLPAGVKRIAVFGSTVRNEALEDSDIDILITLKARDQRPPPLSMFQWIELEEILSQKLNQKVDLVSEDGLSPYIRPYIEQEKVVVYEEG